METPAALGAPTDENMHITPAVVGNDRLEVHWYGPNSSVIRAAQHEGRIDLWTGLATSPVAVTLRDKRNYLDLTGLARLRWMVRTTAIHTLYPSSNSPTGTIAGNRGITTDGEFLQVEVSFGGYHCRNAGRSGGATQGTGPATARGRRPRTARACRSGGPNWRTSDRRTRPARQCWRASGRSRGPPAIPGRQPVAIRSDIRTGANGGRIERKVLEALLGSGRVTKTRK